MSEQEERREVSRRSEAQWRALLEEMEARGLSVGEACEEFGVSKQNLYHWRRKLRSKGEAPMEFLELPFNPPVSSSSIEIHCSKGTRIICPNLTIPELAGLVRELEGGR